jgi:cell division septation protein DedD
MQPKFTHSKSNIIKLTEEAKKKSRHRLIGSIVLLFVALVVLLNVTAKFKPIPINPEIVEIKNSSATLSQKLTASSAAKVAASAINPTAMANQLPAQNNPGTPATLGTNPHANPTSLAAPTSPTKPNPTTANSNLARANKISASPTHTQVKPTASAHELPLQGNLAPSKQHNQRVELANKPAQAATNPADILNDVNPVKHPSGKSYIQFAALSSNDKAIQFQQILATHGITASIQPITTAKGTLYRLRAGPYAKPEAQEKLAKMTQEGYSGIVTGN